MNQPRAYPIIYDTDENLQNTSEDYQNKENEDENNDNEREDKNDDQSQNDNSDNESELSDKENTNYKESAKAPASTENNDGLWKVFGRDSEAGKLLFTLYRSGKPAKINYPKPKVKPKSEQPPLIKQTKLCPQKTTIDYPSKKQVYQQKIAAVDLIPKRKNYEEIKKELDDFKKNPIIPINKGQNRKEIIEKLQDKFKKGRGGLPKGAELPQVNNIEENVDEEEIKARALLKIGKKNLYIRPPSRDKKLDDKVISASQEDEELEKLYGDIEGEIEDRQKYLEELKDYDEPVLKARVKKEIVDRISELQRIIKMIKK